MLVVRSQDKKGLIVNNVVYCVDDKNINVSHMNDYEATIATYSTEEKALKVLDMLEKYCCEHSFRYHNYNNSVPIEEYINIPFQFPQDDEVEV